jgi:predicted nucleic-acid-binding Zn-ribbon protein
MQCSKCGSSNMDFGSVGVSNFPQAWWNPIVSYQSGSNRLINEKTPINSRLCLDCGNLEFSIENISNLVR